MKSRMESKSNERGLRKHGGLCFLLVFLCLSMSRFALAESASSKEPVHELLTGTVFSPISTQGPGWFKQETFPEKVSSLRILPPIIEPPSMPLAKKQMPIDSLILKEPASLSTGESIEVDSGVKIPQDLEPPVPAENVSKPGYPGLGGVTISLTVEEFPAGPEPKTGRVRPLPQPPEIPVGKPIDPRTSFPPEISPVANYYAIPAIVSGREKPAWDASTKSFRKKHKAAYKEMIRRKNPQKRGTLRES